jgi:hypothetical protein
VEGSFLKTLYLVLCPKSWRDGLASQTAEGEPVEVEIRSPIGCCGYMPIFETRPAAEEWSGGQFEIVEFRLYAGMGAGAPSHAVC